jgi:hypothetical protein
VAKRTSRGTPPPTKEPRQAWYQRSDENKDEVARAVTGTVEAINTNQAYREQDNLAAMRYYGGLEYLGFGIGSYARAGSPVGKIGLNVIRSCVNSAQAKIGKNKVKPTPVTNDGDWELQRKAKLLDLFGQGTFYSTKYHKKAPLVFRDGALFGTGAMKTVPQINEEDPGRSYILSERTFINELKIDDADAMSGEPRNLYQEKAIARDVAFALWPDFRESIMKADPVENAFIDVHIAHTDLIQIVEAWHLPSCPGAGDGKHFLGFKNATIEYKEWKRDSFPFAWFRWDDPLLGFFGTGIAQELADIQYEINFLLQRIQEAFRLLGAPCIFVERGSEFPIEQLSNVVGNVYVYTGSPPTVAAFQTIHPEVFAHLDRLYSRAYEIVGISQLSAQSKKPSGLDSGEALREYNDIESERFVIVGQDYEQLACDTFELQIEAAREIAEKNDGNFAVRVHGRRHGRRFVEEIDWADIDMARDQYQLQVFPTSSLPTEPAGRRQEISERIKLGMMTPDEALDQMDLPDTEAANSLALAARHDLEEMFWRFFYADDNKVKYSPPEPFQDLKLGLKLGQTRYLQAKNAGVPDERLELARRWMSDAKAMDDKANQPPPGAPMPGAPPPGMPPGPPGAQPQAPTGAPPPLPVA